MIILLPLMVLFAIALVMGSDCDGSPGHEVSIGAGTEFYFAVTKDADVAAH